MSSVWSAPETNFRLVHIHVLDVNGQPAVNRVAYLRGWDRGAIGPLLEADLGFSPDPSDLNLIRKQGWLFTTDKNGDVTVRLGDFKSWKEADGRPGFGLYALLIERGPDDAGGLSQRFYSPAEEITPYVHFSNWEWGVPLPLPKKGLNLTMTLEKGFTLYGRVVDNQNPRNPLPNLPVNTWNDLNIDTHTGYGGRVFNGSATTDANGEFKIEHEFYHRLNASFGGLWMSSDVQGIWVEQKDDVLDPPGDDGVRIAVRVEIHPNFHYVGRVTDFQGHPIPQADVVVGISSQPSDLSWGDSHHFEHATTDANGNYDLAASSPWGRFLEAETRELGRVDLKWPNGDSPIPPGRYDLKFPAKPIHN